MQTSILDFKQPLEANLSKVNTRKEPKTSEFSKKLKSANESNKPVNSDSDKEKSNVKTNEKKDVDLTKEEKVNKGEEEAILTEETKEDETIQYGNMINILNIKEIKENPDLELKEDLEVFESIEISKANISQDEGLELEEDLDLEVNLEVKNPTKDKADLNKAEDHSNKLVDSKLIETNEKEIVSEKTEESSNKEKPTIQVNDFEESEIVEEENMLNVRESSSKKTSEKSPDNNQKESTDSGKSYELVDGSISEESPEVSNESFGPILKNGLEFSTDNMVEAEIPQVEPKEVVKQIVDQVKFDLSENKNEIKLSLKPEALGEMTMNIELAKDGIVARIMVDNYKTKEVIETNIFQLKEGIKDTGMEIKTFEVFVGNGSDFDQHESNQFNFNQNNKKLKIKNQNKKNNNFINGYEEGTVDKISSQNGKILEGSLNLFA